MLIAMLFGLVGAHPSHASPPPEIVDPKNYVSAVNSLKFTENAGQWDSRAKFVARTGPVDVWVTNTGITYDWHEQIAAAGKSIGKDPTWKNHAVSVEFVGATGKGVAEGLHQVPGLSNYYQGKSLHPRVRSFSAATIKDLYPGVDLISYFDKVEMKPRYDLVVHKGANPDQIRMRYKGAKSLRVTPDGEVKYSVGFDGGSDPQVGEQRQMAYQAGDQGIPYRFMPRQVMEKDGTVGFDVTGYLPDRDLVIDPLVWSTYIGGDGSTIVKSIKADFSQNVYVCGTTSATNFPGSAGTANSGTSGNVYDAFAAKFDSSGNCLFATFYGGATQNTDGRTVGFDSGGNTYFVGNGTAQDWPTTTGPAPELVANNSFLAKLKPDGTLGFAENITGTEIGNPGLNAIAIPAVVSSTGTSTVGVWSNEVAYVIQVDSSGALVGSVIQASTGSVATLNGIDVDFAGNIFVCGQSNDLTLSVPGGAISTNPNASLGSPFPVGYVNKVAFGSTTPTNETFIGGAGWSTAWRVKVDSNNAVDVLGYIDGSIPQTDSSGHPMADTFPTTPGAFNSSPLQANYSGFFAKFTNDLSTLSAATELTSNEADSSGQFFPLDFALDFNNSPFIVAYVAGGIPLTWDYFSGHMTNGVLMQLSLDLKFELYGTYFIHDSSSIPGAVYVDFLENIYLGGETSSNSFPVTAGAYQTALTGASSGFVSVLAPGVPQSMSSIVTDRGSNPTLAGGVGKTLTLTVPCVLPTGTVINFSSDHPTLVTLGGSSTGAVPVVGSNHAVSIRLGTTTDVSADTPVVVTATNGFFTKQITVVIKPFIKQLLLRAPAVTGGFSLTAYVYPAEVPMTDQVVNISSDHAGLIANTSVTIRGISGGLSISGPTTKTLTTGTVTTDTPVIVTATATTVNPSSASSAELIQAARITSISFNAASVASGASSQATVTLATALTTDLNVLLTSSNAAVSPNVNVLITAGNLSGTSTVTTNQVIGRSNFLIRYSNTVTPAQSGFLTVVPLTATAFMSNSTVIEGDTPNLTVNLSAAATVDLPITVVSTNSLSVPAAAGTVTAGNSQVVIPIPTTFQALAYPTVIRLTLSSNGNALGTVSFTLRSIVTSENVVDGSVTGGANASGFVGFFETYTGTRTVTVTSNNPAAFFGTPGTLSVTLPAHGLSSVPFVISTGHVTHVANVTITISALGYPPQRFSLVVNP